MTEDAALPQTAPDDSTDPTDPSRSARRGSSMPNRDEEWIGDHDLATWPTRAGRLFMHGVANVVRLLPGGHQAVRWSKANSAFVIFAVISLGIIGLFASLSEDLFDDVAGSNGLTAIDRPVLDAAITMRRPWLNTAITGYTHVGGPVGMPILASAVVLFLAVSRRRWTPIVLAAITAAGALAMTIFGKDFAARARPPVSLAVPPFESSPSFPSGHTLNAAALTTIVVYLVLIRADRRWQRVTTIAIGTVFVVTMGLSRVFLGHHWLTDVLAGWMLGIGWALAVITAHRLYLTIKRESASSSD